MSPASYRGSDDQSGLLQTSLVGYHAFQPDIRIAYQIRSSEPLGQRYRRQERSEYHPSVNHQGIEALHVQSFVGVLHVVQRITEGLTHQEFCDQIMNGIRRTFWDICKSLKGANAALYQHNQSRLQSFDDVEVMDASAMHSNMAPVRQVRETLNNLSRQLKQHLQHSATQKVLLDDAENDRFGDFAQKCIDLALHRDPRTFLALDMRQVSGRIDRRVEASQGGLLSYL